MRLCSEDKVHREGLCRRDMKGGLPSLGLQNRPWARRHGRSDLKAEDFQKKIAPLVFPRVMGGPTPPRAARALCEAGPAGEQVEIAPSELWVRTCKNPVMHSLQPMLLQSHDGVFVGPCACALKDYTDRGLLSNSLCRLRPQLSHVSLGREMPATAA